MNRIPTNESPPGQGGEVGKATALANGLCASQLDSVKPTYPPIDILPGRVLARLLTGRGLTHKDSWLELGHARLADSIWKLRRLGWPVQMEEQVVPTSDGGRKASIGIYFLEPEMIESEAERGQQYAAECARIEAERRTA